MADVNEVIQKFITQEQTHDNLVAMTKDAQARIETIPTVAILTTATRTTATLTTAILTIVLLYTGAHRDPSRGACYLLWRYLLSTYYTGAHRDPGGGARGDQGGGGRHQILGGQRAGQPTGGRSVGTQAERWAGGGGARQGAAGALRPRLRRRACRHRAHGRQAGGGRTLTLTPTPTPTLTLTLTPTLPLPLTPTPPLSRQVRGGQARPPRRARDRRNHH